MEILFQMKKYKNGCEHVTMANARLVFKMATFCVSVQKSNALEISCMPSVSLSFSGNYLRIELGAIFAGLFGVGIVFLESKITLAKV
jgi:hypothetical protein